VAAPSPASTPCSASRSAPTAPARSPGPACYGRGGREPTVTDADVTIGKIDIERFAGGKIAIHPDKAELALSSTLKGMSAEQGAIGIAEIVDENMANAARVHAVERGVAISERTLIAFGGAAPLHASRLAEKLGIARVIVPPDAGVGSAVGFLAAPAAYEMIRSRYMRLSSFDASEANALINAMEQEALSHCRAAAGTRSVSVRRSTFMRYAGQGHEITVALPDRKITAGDTATFRADFEREYTRLFARHIPNAEIEIMSWLVLATTTTAPPKRLADVPRKPAPKALGDRSIFDARLGRRLSVPMFERDHLVPGTSLAGPALVVEAGTSTYVSPSFDLGVDAGGALVLTAKFDAS
jgi:N-methylhydantoinase A